MNLFEILREFLASVHEAVHCGDLAGHLASWWWCVRHPELLGEEA